MVSLSIQHSESSLRHQPGLANIQLNWQLLYCFILDEYENMSSAEYGLGEVWVV